VLVESTAIVVCTIVVGIVDHKPGSYPVIDSMISPDGYGRQLRVVTILETVLK
jgi:hypothetical protein